VFVRLNCAAIPLDLLESELLGTRRRIHGAIAQKVGRFELADKGTLFLDEVGDIPPALQPKLLPCPSGAGVRAPGQHSHSPGRRPVVLQRTAILMDMVNQGEFRTDLYYRLNVFPVLLPPLRERREDIPSLVTHFVELFGRRMGRQIEHIPPETLSASARTRGQKYPRTAEPDRTRRYSLKRCVLPNLLPTARSQVVLASPVATTLRTQSAA